MQEIFLLIQHHWILSSAFVATFILLIVVEYLRLQHGEKRLTPSEATRLINHDNGIVIDIRNEARYAAGHIIGSVSIPKSDWEARHKKIETYKQKPILLVCETGQDSQRLAASLTKKGFSVSVLAGGIRSWSDANMPLVKD